MLKDRITSNLGFYKNRERLGFEYDFEKLIVDTLNDCKVETYLELCQIAQYLRYKCDTVSRFTATFIQPDFDNFTLNVLIVNSQSRSEVLNKTFNIGINGIVNDKDTYTLNDLLAMRNIQQTTLQRSRLMRWLRNNNLNPCCVKFRNKRYSKAVADSVMTMYVANKYNTIDKNGIPEGQAPRYHYLASTFHLGKVLDGTLILNDNEKAFIKDFIDAFSANHSIGRNKVLIEQMKRDHGVRYDAILANRYTFEQVIEVTKIPAVTIRNITSKYHLGIGGHNIKQYTKADVQLLQDMSMVKEKYHPRSFQYQKEISALIETYNQSRNKQKGDNNNG